MIDERDEDRDLLEAHLDGELAPAEAEALGRRLAVDARLAAALEELRAERAVRRAVWGAYEPSDAEAAAVAAGAVAAAVRDGRWQHVARVARLATAAAAVVLIAFAGGWVARGRLGADQAVPAVHSSGGGGARPFASTGGGVGAGSFPVALTDESGRIIAVQHFDDPQSARQFADDVGRWQSRPQRRAPQAEPFVPVSGEF